MDQPLRLLLVEDSKDDAHLVLRELRSAGYTVAVERVDSAADYLAALDRGGWHLIIADFSMPGFSGRAAFDIHRARSPEIPFIFVSGTMGEEAAVEAMKAGAADYVMKGNLRRLVPAIERELREAAVRRERRAAEEALRRSEERFATVFRASPVGISITTARDGRFVDASSSLLRMLGFERPEVVGRTTQELGVWTDLEERNGVVEALRKGRAITNRETQLRTKTGEIRSTLCNFELIETEGESCLASFVLDVTETKELEEQLRQAQRLESVGRLAAGVAHDFNNLLTVVLSCCDLLMDDEAEAPWKEVGEIRQAAMSAVSLTRQLLAVGGKQVFQLRRVDMSAAVSRAQGLLVRALGDRIELACVLAPAGTAMARVDPGQLDQVLMNLAVNARDAMPSGGRLRIETATVELDGLEALHPGARPGRFVRLSVADSGLGMDNYTLEHLFEPFFTTKDEGTGLGLATVHGIVSQSGGFVRVDSEPGRGSRFEVYLPWLEDPEEETSKPPLPTTGPETILVVEDERAVREITCRMLGAQGYVVLEAADGRSALQLAVEYPGSIHAMVTDLAMPDMSGSALAERMAAIRPETKVLFTSGYASPSTLRHGAIASDKAFLQKPFTSAGLSEKVREVLSGCG